MITDPRFTACLPFTLQQECNVYTGTSADWANPRNFDDDKNDPGGATMCGLTHTDLDQYCEAHGLPDRDVRQIGQETGETIYYANYWLPFCHRLPPGLDLFFFDTRVNMGTHRAVMLLQASLKIAADGAWGPKTDAAVAAITYVPDVIHDDEQRRAAVYRSFRTFKFFGTDWIRRDQEIAAEALKMATGA
jgi:lysozyme family protein